MCGAVGNSTSTAAAIGGSSPRVRSGRLKDVAQKRRVGIISACAERSERRGAGQRRLRDHLRVCGAVSSIVILRSRRMGSSPRVRSGPLHPFAWNLPLGIISACAERSLLLIIKASINRDHLRVCGAVGIAGHAQGFELGSSPRVRSGLHAEIWLFHPAGIISACAERSN